MIDSIVSENATIYTEADVKDKKIIVYIGNLSPNEELTFIDEFIQFIESKDNNNFEYDYSEFYRN